LECSSSTSGFANITTVALNNKTENNLQAIYSTSRIKSLEGILDVWFVMGEMQVFILEGVEFLQIGESLKTFSGCIGSDDTDTVSKQYESVEGVSCSVNSGCEVVANQLQAQISSITTSVGVAGGGGVGCFCGSCLIVALFYRRKKKKITNMVVVDNQGVVNNFTFSDLFTENQELINPLFGDNVS